MKNATQIGIAGLGTVGGSLVKLLAGNSANIHQAAGSAINVNAISAQNKNKDRGFDIEQFEWFDDPRELAASEDIDIFVELIGGEAGIALEAIETAIENGKHIVTANKALLAKHGLDIARKAEEKNVNLYYEAAAAGGIPIVKTLRESLSGNNISRIYGIMNGTCNYILTRMKNEGRSFNEILKDAQDLGYAEADPTADIGGFDTAHKLAILASLAFGTEIDFDAVYCEGIEKITLDDIQAADKLGYTIKLLGVAVSSDAGIEQRVHPTMVKKSTPIAQIDGVTNAVAIDSDLLGESLLVGPGAGGDATASAVLGDIVDITAGRRVAAFGRSVDQLKKVQRTQMRAHEGGYYVSLVLFDQPGAFAKVAMRMAEQEISLESIVQATNGTTHASDVKPVILITHETSEANIRAAFQAIEKDGYIAGEPRMIRIER